MRQLTLLGSTGSIGESTLDVVARHPHRFQVHALVARKSVDQVFAQCVTHRPRYVTRGERGAGFAELAQALLVARNIGWSRRSRSESLLKLSLPMPRK